MAKSKRKATQFLERSVRDQLCELRGRLLEWQHYAGNEIRQHVMLITAPRWWEHYADCAQVTFDGQYPELEIIDNPGGAPMATTADWGRFQAPPLPLKPQHKHVVTAGVSLADDLGLLFVWDVDESPHPDPCLSLRSFSAVTTALERYGRLLRKTPASSVWCSRLPRRALKNVELIEWACASLGFAGAHPTSERDVEIRASMSLEDPPRDLDILPVPSGFNALPLLTMSWEPGEGPKHWRKQWGEAWPAVIVGSLKPMYPKAIVQLLDSILGTALDASDSHRPRYGGRKLTGYPAGGRWVVHLMYQLHDEQKRLGLPLRPFENKELREHWFDIDDGYAGKRNLVADPCPEDHTKISRLWKWMFAGRKKAGERGGKAAYKRLCEQGKIVDHLWKLIEKNELKARDSSRSVTDQL